MAALAKRRLTRHDELAWLAWHTAALPLMKKFPKLTDLQARPRRIRVMSEEEMLRNMKMTMGAE